MKITSAGADRLRKLLEALSEYPHGQDGIHWQHSLASAEHAEVCALLNAMLLGEL